MNPALARQHFACTRLHAILTRASCARSYRLASLPAPKAGSEAINARAIDRCAGCSVGAEHARGKGSLPPVTLVPLRVDKAERPRWCLACGKALAKPHARQGYCDAECKAFGLVLTGIERAAEVSL